MAGTWICTKNYAFDHGAPLPGAIAQFYMADTLTPMTVYVDYGLTTPAGSSVEADGNGQWPVVYLDETAGFYRYRTIRPDGSVLDDMTTLAIIGPGMGGGGSGGSSIDSTQLATTGDTKWRPSIAPINGWVRCNAGTIGSAASIATEMHSDACQALFTFIWLNFANSACPVTGGRGLTALADWTAAKVIATPDMRGRALFGLDGMGNALAGRITSATISGSGGSLGTPDVVGSSGGQEIIYLDVSMIPSHGHVIDPPNTTTSAQSVDHAHLIDPPNTLSGLQTANHRHSIDPPVTNTGAEAAHVHGVNINTGIQSANPVIGVSTANGSGPVMRGGGAQDSGTSGTSGNHTHNVSGNTGAGTSHFHSINIASFSSGYVDADHQHYVDIAAFWSGGINTGHTHTVDIAPFSSGPTGGGAAHINLPPAMVGCFFMKL